jgi:hypothetical protein
MSYKNVPKDWPSITIRQDNTRSFPVFPDGRQAVMVVGHERSGNHFMMNTLAACYGHVSQPWVDLDYRTFNINYFKSVRIAEMLFHLGTNKVASVIKSHHQLDFFKEQIENILSVVKIIYVYRNPVDVMISFWKLLHGCSWREGPQTDSPLSLARSEPNGQLMRYQMFQYQTMIHRWAAHVSNWIPVTQVSSRVTAVAYEALDQRFEETVHGLSKFMERQPMQIKRPSRSEAVIKPATLPDWILQHKPDRETLTTYCCEVAGELMHKLHYSQTGIRGTDAPGCI